MTDFARTLQTASDAEGIAKLLTRVAEGKRPPVWSDAERLKVLAERYTDYAASLREMVARDGAAEPDPDQPRLF